MGSFSIWHWLIAGVVILVVFGGKGKLSGIMGDAAKGIKAFREGLKTEDGATTQTAATDGHAQVITPAAATPVKEEPKA